MFYVYRASANTGIPIYIGVFHVFYFFVFVLAEELEGVDVFFMCTTYTCDSFPVCLLERWVSAG